MTGQNYLKQNIVLTLNRRKFLKYGAIATGGFAIAACANQQANTGQLKSVFKINENNTSQYTEVFTMAQKIWLEEKIIDKTVDAKTVTDTSFLESLYS